MNEQLKLRINNDKEILSVLPQNTLRNRRKYKEKVQELLASYTNDKKIIYEKIVKENKRLTDIEEDVRIKKLEEEIEDLYQKIVLFNEYCSSYELLGLDVILYNLGKFYDNNLDEVNENIQNALELFKKIGIDLTIKDFYYSCEVREYMHCLLANQDNNIIKETFEKLYWKSPDLIKHIMLNFKSLYYQNKKLFDKYVVLFKDKILSSYNNDLSILIKTYQEKVILHKQLVDDSKYLYLVKFLDKTYDIKNFNSDKVVKSISELVVDKVVDNTDELLRKFLNSLLEYRSYLDYAFLIDDIKKLYDDKASYKRIDGKLKEILTKEKQIIKLNKKIEWLLKRKKDSRTLPLITKNNLLLEEIEPLYNELELDKFKENILMKLTDESSIYDYLMLASSSYIYLKDLSKRNELDYDAIKLIKDVRLFLFNPFNVIIDNTTIKDVAKINMIIADKYKLWGLDIDFERLSVESVDSLIERVNNIVLYNHIIHSGWDFSGLDFICKSRDILIKESGNNE